MLPKLALLIILGLIPCGDAFVSDMVKSARKYYYFLVNDIKDANVSIRRGLEITAKYQDTASSCEDALISAYHGAFLAFRAREGLNPVNKIADLREGLRLLDQVAAEHPDLEEAIIMKNKIYENIPFYVKALL